MATIVTRAGKGSPLTHVEVDANFTNLNTDKAELASPAFTGQASFADGTAAAPSIAHTGDLNAGLFFPTADTVAVSTSSTERLRITTSGLVGIGTTPAKLFHVYRNNTDQDAQVQIEQDGSGSPVLGFLKTGVSAWLTGLYNSDDSYRIAASTADLNTNPRLVITTAGNVGIGTTSPQAKLDIVHTGLQFRIANSAISGYGFAQFGQSATATQNWHIGSEGDGTFRWYNGNSGAGTERMRITSAGSVGIGTSSPITPLHVDGASITTGVSYKAQAQPTSKAAAATLTIAELLTGIIQYTGAVATLTLPTGTLIEGGLPATFPSGMSFDVSFINTGAALLTIGTATGLTLTGTMTVATGTSGILRFRKSTANNYNVYRIS